MDCTCCASYDGIKAFGVVFVVTYSLNKRTAQVLSKNCVRRKSTKFNLLTTLRIDANDQDGREKCLQGVQKPQSLSSDMTGHGWKFWLEEWKDYATIIELEKKSKRFQGATFQTCLGREAREIYNGLPFEQEEDKNDVNKTIALLQEYFIGKVNTTYERRKFSREIKKKARLPWHTLLNYDDYRAHAASNIK